jgi:hypothetical protein
VQPQQPYEQPQPPYQQPPPYAQNPAPPPYLRVSAEARDALASKARRDIGFGVAWLAFGLFITLFTLARFGPYLIVAFGPMGYGIYKIIKGTVNLHRHG